MKRSIQDVEHSDSFSEWCGQYNISIHTANDAFQQKESIEDAIDNTYSIIHKQADTGAKLKIERSVDTIIQLVGLVFSGQICISHNRDLDLNAEKISSITQSALQSNFSLAQELQEPIVLTEHGEYFTLEGGMHRVVSYACVCLGLLPYKNKQNKLVRACPHVFKTDQEKDFYTDLMNLTEGYSESLELLHTFRESECDDDFKKNYYAFLQLILKYNIITNPFNKDGSLIPVEDPLKLQMTLSNIKLPVVRISYQSKRVKTDNDRLACRVSKSLAYNDGLSKDHSPTDLIKILFFNEHPNSKLHDVLSSIPCQITQVSNVFPNGIFCVDSQSISPSILMSVYVLANLEEEPSNDIVPRKFSYNSDPLKESWIAELMTNVNSNHYVSCAQDVAAQWRWVVEEFAKMYTTRSMRKQSMFCQVVKTEITKREKNRMGFLYTIILCLIILKTLDISDISSFLMSKIPVKGKTQIMMKYIFSCMNNRLKTLGTYTAPFQFESVVRHCNTIATFWKEGKYEQADSDNDDEEGEGEGEDEDDGDDNDDGDDGDDGDNDNDESVSSSSSAFVPPKQIISSKPEATDDINSSDDDTETDDAETEHDAPSHDSKTLLQDMENNDHDID